MSLSHSSSSNHYCALLRLYCETRNFTKAKTLHSHIIKTLPYPETFLLNNLISYYAGEGECAGEESEDAVAVGGVGGGI
jgi:pentatricopeptide repeat protein